jgi:predicted DCC family thiol-disulfide oxidoreductase YuxK
MKIELYYDKECPFCNRYAQYVKLKEKHELILYNARATKDSIGEFTLQSYDINDGFIIQVDENKIYQGSDAIIFLNEVSSKKVYFPNNHLFKSIIYPMIKFLRVVLLKIMFKKSKI